MLQKTKTVERERVEVGEVSSTWIVIELFVFTPYPTKPSISRRVSHLGNRCSVTSMTDVTV